MKDKPKTAMPQHKRLAMGQPVNNMPAKPAVKKPAK